MKTHDETLAEVAQYLASLKHDRPKWQKDKSRCGWADALILSFAGAVECLKDCEAFYRSEERREPKDLLSSYMEKPCGLADTVQSHLEWQAPRLSVFPDKDQMLMLHLSSMAFEQILRSATDVSVGFPIGATVPLSCIDPLSKLEACMKQGGKSPRDLLARAAHKYVLYLYEAAYRLKILEHRIWRNHPEWELSGYEWAPDGPFDCRKLIDNRADALIRFDEAHPNVFRILYKVRDNVRAPTESKPVFFVWYDRQERPHSFEGALRELLVLDPVVRFENPVMTAVYGEPQVDRHEVSPCLTRERQQVLVDLNEYLQLRATQCKAGSPEQRLWYEADAEMLANLTGVYDAASADRLLARVNAAQRESWIGRMMRGGDKASDAGRLPEAADPAGDAEGRPAAKAATAEDTLAKLGVLLEKALARQPQEPPSRPKRKKVSRTAPLMGPKSTTMQRQLRAFAKYVESHPIDTSKRDTTRGARANQFWNLHAEEYERWAKQGGVKKGYASAKSLAGAYADLLS